MLAVEAAGTVVAAEHPANAAVEVLVVEFELMVKVVSLVEVLLTVAIRAPEQGESPLCWLHLRFLTLFL